MRATETTKHFAVAIVLTIRLKPVILFAFRKMLLQAMSLCLLFNKEKTLCLLSSALPVGLVIKLFASWFVGRRVDQWVVQSDSGSLLSSFREFVSSS